MLEGSVLEFVECQANNAGCIYGCVNACLLSGDTPEFVVHKTSDQIADILFGSKKIRLGSAPTPEERNFLIERLSRFVSVGVPIQITCLWGAIKGYGLDSERLSIDISDLLGIKRYVELHRHVSKIYPPGLCVDLIREDVGELALNSNTANLKERMSDYCNGLDKICDICEIDKHVRFVNESAFIASRGLDPVEFLGRGHKNARLFYEYWKDSEGTPEVTWSYLPSYRKLCAEGWKGTVPNLTRDHYIARVSTEFPDASHEKKVFQACLYLGVALTRHQIGLYRGRFEDKLGYIPPIRSSFVPYPPGTPDSLRLGRLEYKVKTSKNSNSSIPPWCGFGFMTQKEPDKYDTTTLSIREYQARRFEKVVVEVKRRDKSQRFRADLLVAV